MKRYWFEGFKGGLGNESGQKTEEHAAGIWQHQNWRRSYGIPFSLKEAPFRVKPAPKLVIFKSKLVPYHLSTSNLSTTTSTYNQNTNSAKNELLELLIWVIETPRI